MKTQTQPHKYEIHASVDNVEVNSIFESYMNPEELSEFFETADATFRNFSVCGVVVYPSEIDYVAELNPDGSETVIF